MYQSFKENANRLADVIDGKTGQVVGFVGGAVALAAGNASATGTDFTALTASVDFATVITAILAIAAIMAAVHVAWKGVKMVLSALKTL